MELKSSRETTEMTKDVLLWNVLLLSVGPAEEEEEEEQRVEAMHSLRCTHSV